jgi:hypothetical protein
MRVEDARDYVQLRDGSSYVGTVTQQAVHIEVGFSTQPITIATAKILHIVLSRGGEGLDEINLHDGSSVKGKMLDATVAFRSEELGELSIPTERILAIQLLRNL